MNNLLEQIVAAKRKEVEAARQVRSLTWWERQPAFRQSPASLSEALASGSGLIAEFKRASPSRGLLRPDARVAEVVTGYEKSGASAVSVLTDRDFFQAAATDLPQASRLLAIPVLRKDFIIDSYQVVEARGLGAGAILLIAAILNRQQLADLQNTASGLGLEVLVEVHREEDLDKLTGREQLVGVNNRNLETFEVDTDTSIRLAPLLGEVLKVTESGLDRRANLKALYQAGYRGFLVGEAFMRAPDPAVACRHFVERLLRIRHAG